MGSGQAPSSVIFFASLLVMVAPRGRWISGRNRVDCNRGIARSIGWVSLVGFRVSGAPRRHRSAMLVRAGYRMERDSRLSHSWSVSLPGPIETIAARDPTEPVYSRTRRTLQGEWVDDAFISQFLVALILATLPASLFLLPFLLFPALPPLFLLPFFLLLLPFLRFPAPLLPLPSPSPSHQPGRASGDSAATPAPSSMHNAGHAPQRPPSTHPQAPSASSISTRTPSSSPPRTPPLPPPPGASKPESSTR